MWVLAHVSETKDVACLYLSCPARSKEQAWKICDLGSCVRASTVAPTGVTLAYAPPEVLSGKPVSCAFDMWSLGIIMYEQIMGACKASAGYPGGAILVLYCTVLYCTAVLLIGGRMSVAPP